jgi:primosomal protein N' (replication factor Y)
MYAKVIIEIGAKNLDKTFIYRVPSIYQDIIDVGYRVKVPFGKQILEGFVLEITDDYNGSYEIRDVVEVVDDYQVLNKEMLELGKYISNTTLCSLILAYQIMLPKALKAQNKTNMKIKINRYVTINKSREEIIEYVDSCRFPKQKELLNDLLEKDRILITKIDSTIKTLEKKELIKIIEEEKYRYEYTLKKEYNKVTLNEEQTKVINEVTNNLDKNNVYLLYGVTGSGKTEVYMNIISKVIERGKQAIMLVPEISLTPQIVDRFVSRFGDKVAILHSGLSDSERYDEYRKIKENKVDIVVGARSAIYAPVTKLGVVIIDEEHSTSYKQDNHPRYDAKDIAIWRSKYHNCPVVMGSATPTLESFARAGNHVYKLLVLNKRASGGSLPDVSIIDMKEEIKQGNFIFSKLLKDKIEEKLARNEQVILFLNRRGYSSMLTCVDCGETFKCPRCDISLTYHKTSDILRCHYCGYAHKRITTCPKCKGTNIKDYGLGTERLEEELNKMYNKARIVRMDMDTTSKKGMHAKIIEDFENHKYDILLGTQMIAKGLDFPLVTLVGVINADTSLNVPDFRSAERTFELLCQVSGRAGRSNLKGEVIIQTYNDSHYSIVLSKTHDYLNFYKEEMRLRKQLKYPPYYYLTLVKISTKDYDYGFKEANKIGDYLRKKLDANYTVLGPTMANVFKVNNVYSFQCIIKYRNDTLLKGVLLDIDTQYKLNTKIKVEIDVNPIKL